MEPMGTPWAGSSPRMRGTPTAPVSTEASKRIIPADAGNTRTGRRDPAASPDHPRGCGEHPARSPMDSLPLGSSPRMRGTPSVSTRLQNSPGIIPADAGNTRHRVCGVSDLQDHPRGCGEHASGHPNCLCVTGSSPRMRGTLPRERGWFPPARIIPADAGNTRSRGLSLSLG